MHADQQLNQIAQCWNLIGVGGDRSCVELETVIHCRNCSVYATAGRELLEREVPLDYLNEWTAALAQSQTELVSSLALQPSDTATQQTAFRIGRAADTLSAIVFRLSDECFALPMPVLQEVTHPVPIHTIPHCRNEVLLGLITIRGEILLCASLHKLLGLISTQPSLEPTLQRMLVVGQRDRAWVFPVDEVQRICRFHLSELKATPVVVSHATETYTQGVIDWQNEKVNYLDAELLLHALDRKLL